MKTRHIMLTLFSCAALGLGAYALTPEADKIDAPARTNVAAANHDGHVHDGHNHAKVGHDHSANAACHLGCNADSAFGHSCALTTPLGFFDVFGKAPLTLIGHAAPAVQVEGDRFRVAVTVERVLKGTSTETLSVDVVHEHGEVAIPAGTRVLLALNGDADAGYTLRALKNSVVLLDKPETFGAESYVASFFNRVDGATSVTPLIDAICEGGQVTRFRAALDYQLAEEEAMSAADFARIAALFDGVSGWDPALPPIMQILATSKNPQHAATLVSLLETTAAFKTFEVLERLLDMPGIIDGAIPALQPYLADGIDAQQRRLAAFLAARSEAAEAQDLMRTLLEDADLDVASEAIIGLAGSNDVALRSRILDEVKKRLASGPVEMNETELGKIVRQRQLYSARHEWHNGEDFRLMAAIYFVARSPEATERNWLAGRLNWIENFGIRTFAEAKLNGVWQNYDSPW